MKILQVTPRYFPSLGGVEETVKQYSERLVTQFGHQVKVVTSDLDSDRSKIVNGVAVDRLYSLPGAGRGPFMPVTPTLILKLAFDQSDLWHLHANKRFGTDVGALVNLIKNKPLVFSPYAGMFGTTLLGRIHNKTISKLAFQAHTTIVISNFEKSLIEKSGLKVKRFVILPIGVDVHEFKRADLSVQERFKMNSKTILFVGRLTAHKGLDTLIKAMPRVLKNIPEANLLVVGPDFGEKESFQKLALLNQVSEKVIFAGAVTREALLGAYKSSAVFCLPSRSEAFGIVMIEAMAAGVPVIAANNTAMPEIVKNGETGLLFDTESPFDLADKIILTLEDKKSRENLINNASDEVAEKYNWDKIVAKLDKIYQEAVSS